MNLWRFFKKLDYSTLWQLFILSVRNVVYIIPTIRATNLTVRLSDEHFAKLHHDNNATNGFRHALWNILIAKYCLKWNKNEAKVLNWTKKITDWHEEFSPNEDLAKTMDLHNNQIGRTLFLENQKNTIANFILLLKKEMVNSVHIKSLKEIAESPLNLVHIERLESI